jgi:hypothetical protein
MFDQINAFAAAHPWYVAAATTLGGFFLREFVFTNENARAIIKWWFARQRAALKKLGRSDAEVNAAMKCEADFLLSAAQEAETEASNGIVAG